MRTEPCRSLRKADRPWIEIIESIEPHLENISIGQLKFVVEAYSAGEEAVAVSELLGVIEKNSLWLSEELADAIRMSLGKESDLLEANDATFLDLRISTDGILLLRADEI